MRGIVSSSRTALAAILLLVAAQAFVVNYLGRNNYLPEGSEHWTEDWLIHYFSKRLDKPQNDIVLVVVDAESLEKAGLPATIPVDRGWMSKLVTAVAALEPLAIGIDFYFTTPIDPVKDELLAAAIRDARPPIVVATVDDAFLATAAQQKFQQAFIQRVNRPAGHIHLKRANEILALGDRATRGVDHGPIPKGFTSFSSTLARLPPVAARFGSPEIPEGTQRIDWLLAPEGGETFTRVQAYEIVSGPGRVANFKNKIVLIGPDFAGLDRHSVPFSLGNQQLAFPGVFVQAQALAQILEHRFFFAWTGAQQFILLFCIGIVGAALGWTFHSRRADLVLGIAGTLLIIGLSVPFFMARIPFPTALAIISWAISLSIAQFLRAGREA